MAAAARLTPAGFQVAVSGATPVSGMLEADAVIAATGFKVPLRDLPKLGLHSVLGGRVPALSPYWESISLPGAFFAGNATVGSVGLRRHGVGSASTSVKGFRYNARVLARHLAERLGHLPPYAQALPDDQVAPLLARELVRCGDLWGQKAYLARVVEIGSGVARDRGVQPLAFCVEEAGPDALAVTIETDARGVTFPCVYVRRGGTLDVHGLDPHPLHEFDGEPYERELAKLVQYPPGP